MRESRRGLFFNAAAKIPMQLFILFIGVMVFVFYIFSSRRCCSSRLDQARLEAAGARAHAYAPIEATLRRGVSSAGAAADRLLARTDGDGRGRPASSAARLSVRRSVRLDAARRDAAALARSARRERARATRTTSS